ncbi:MAG: nucleotide exchange factor GrpE [Gemmatimonadetes bacterium]|nr:nucleotide exchange factor GrpE [Gemmatimonadota bacterium]
MRKRPEKASRKAAEAAPPAASVESEVAGLRSEVERLRTELQALQGQHGELQDKYLRLWAEFDNYRKRMAKERGEDATRAQAELLFEILEPLDDLNRVLTLDSIPPEARAVVEGVRLVQEKLKTVLERMGLEVIAAEGEPFDPELHEALVTTPAESPEEDGKVALELSRGYRFRDRVLRPARVQVKRYAPDEGEAAGEAT